VEASVFDKTLFFVQPYVLRHGRIVARGALTFHEKGEALAAGAALARRRAGVVVLAQSYNAQQSVMTRPAVLRIHGRVPDEWIGAAAA
jgi:hypothetical protein